MKNDARARVGKVSMRLDIGVGLNPLGDVNVDVVPNPMADIMGDLQALPFRDGSISRVICRMVLEHVDDPWKALAELRRIVTPSGTVEIAVPKVEFTNNSFYYFAYFLLNLPLTLSPHWILILRERIRQINRRDVAVYHTHIITEEDVGKFFRIVKIEEYGDILHSVLTRGKKAKYFSHKRRVLTAYLFTCRRSA